MEAQNPLSGNERRMLFISHATPEDNAFARWLALQLANEGYPVWCDLTRLLGGEDFWKDIQEAIRKRSIRFLFALSRSSNAKDGTLQELACAKAVAAQVRTKIKDFIIALKLDDLPYSEIDIEIQRLNHISFTTSWAVGLNQLLKKIEEDNVPEDPRFNPNSVAFWWRSQAEYRGSSTNLNWRSQTGIGSRSFLRTSGATTSRGDQRVNSISMFPDCLIRQQKPPISAFSRLQRRTNCPISWMKVSILRLRPRFE